MDDRQAAVRAGRGVRAALKHVTNHTHKLEIFGSVTLLRHRRGVCRVTFDLLVPVSCTLTLCSRPPKFELLRTLEYAFCGFWNVNMTWNAITLKVYEGTGETSPALLRALWAWLRILHFDDWVVPHMKWHIAGFLDLLHSPPTQLQTSSVAEQHQTTTECWVDTWQVPWSSSDTE